LEWETLAHISEIVCHTLLMFTVAYVSVRGLFAEHLNMLSKVTV